MRLSTPEQTLNSFKKEYQVNAKLAKREFNLTPKQFEDLVSTKCYYCGREPFTNRNHSKYVPHNYNGIDRLNNSKGYDVNNCVPCCPDCNRAKATLTVKEFISLVMNIAKVWQAKY